MGFLRKRVLRRFGFLGRIADLALLAGALLKFASRKGWISEQQIASLGLDRFAPPAKSSGVTAGTLPLGEMALGAGAAWRLLRRKKSTSKRRRRVR